MRVFPVALLVPALALCAPVSRAADSQHSQRAAAIRLLTDYWASQHSSFEGWLGGSDPGYVPVAPPDSSLWPPGTLVLLTETGGLVPVGSPERFVPSRKVKVLGQSGSDVAVLGNLIFGSQGVGQFQLQDLAGVLETLGLLRMPSDAAGELRAELARSGVQRVTLSFPNAQVHRLAPSDLEIYLENTDSSTARRLLAEPAMRLITAAVFLKNVRLRLDATANSSGVTSWLKQAFGAELRARGDGAVDFNARGVYVAVQTSRFVLPALTEIAGGKAAQASMIDSTLETRGVLTRLLAGF